MPKSKVRKKVAYTPPPRRSASKMPSAPWVGAVMLTCFVVGLVWLVAYYLTNGEAPPFSWMPGWADLAIGFGVILVGFGMSTKWR